MNNSDLNFHIDNIASYIEDIFELGKDEFSHCTALAYSERLHKRTEYVQNIMHGLGMQCDYDAGANLIGVLPGVKNKKRLMLTSHLDTVINAGAYDGVLGIVLPLEVIAYWQQKGIKLDHTLELRVCMAEESPGVVGMFGSKLCTGQYTFSDLEKMNLAYDSKTSVVEAINRYFRQYLGKSNFSFNEQKLREMQLDAEDYLAALEIHIEQFTLLAEMAKERDGKPCLGVMTAIGGHRRCEIYLACKKNPRVELSAEHQEISIKFFGTSAHSGATPMGEKYREDAAVSFARQYEAVLDNYFKKSKAKIISFQINDSSITSVPSEVELLLAVDNSSDVKEFVRKLEDLLLASISNAKAEIRLLELCDSNKKAVASSLLGTISKLISGVEANSKNSPDSNLRATITKCSLDVEGASLFLDVRSDDSSSMDDAVARLPGFISEKEIELKIEEVSSKEPVLFDKGITKFTEDALEIILANRIMKGLPCIPGQDISNFSAIGIPSALLFVESGTGHHPQESVRPAAINDTFLAIEALLRSWDGIEDFRKQGDRNAD